MQKEPFSALQTVAARILEKTNSLEKPVIIAVGGPGGSGKSTFARQLAEQLGDAVVLALDHYKTSRAFRKNAGIYGPHPDANKMALIKQHLDALKRCEGIDQPVYDMATGDALETTPFVPKSYVIVEGEVSTYPMFKPHIDFSIFIDASFLTQLAARLGRDVQQRGHSKKKASLNFLHSNLREFPAFGAPTRHTADLRLFCRTDYCLELDSIF